MESLTSTAVVLLPLAYLLAAVAYGLVFFTSNRTADRLASPWLLGTVGVHLAYLGALTLRWRQLPAATVPQAFSIMAFAVALVYLLVEWREKDRSSGFWLVSLVFVFQLFASLLARPEPPSRELLHMPLFAIHVFLALLGYTAFAVAATYGFLYLRLYRELKRGTFSTFYGKLPPLEILDGMMGGALVVGFLALSGAVVCGLIGAESLLGTVWWADPKILSTLLVWALYGVSLLLRWRHRWQGRQTALVSLAGLGVILFSLVGVNYLFTGFHGFG